MNLRGTLALAAVLAASPARYSAKKAQQHPMDVKGQAAPDGPSESALLRNDPPDLVSGGRARNVTVGTSPRGRPKNLCYSFLLSGDLYLTCNGKTTRLTHSAHLVDFAVDASGSLLAMISQVGPHHELASYSLGGTSRKPRVSRAPNEAYAVLHSTCGTILAFYEGRATDIEMNQSLAFAPYIDFRCSSDRESVVGMTKSSYALLTGFPPHVLVSGGRNPNGPGAFDFSLSASGQTVAYDSLKGSLCLLRVMGGPPSCTRRWAMGGWTDRISVSDTDGVLFTDETGQEQPCYYDTLGHASRHPKHGYSADACSAIYWWKGGKGKPKILHNLAILPQWVTPPAAAALAAWAARRGHHRRNRGGK